MKNCLRLSAGLMALSLSAAFLNACTPGPQADTTNAKWLLVGIVSADARATHALVPMSCVLAGNDCASETRFVYTKLGLAYGDAGARDAASGDLLITAEKEPTHLFKVTEDGTATDLSGADETIGQVVQSPDGSTVAYERITDGANEVWLIDSDGSNPRLLTDGLAPAWSPDGKTLVVARPAPDGAGRDLWLVTVADGQARQLTNTPNVVEQDMAFSPDGTQLTFGAADLQTHLTHVNLMTLTEGSQPVDLTPGAPFVSPIAFDPTGQLLLVGMTEDNVLKLTLIDLQGNAQSIVPINLRKSQGDGGANAAAWITRSKIVFIRRLAGLTYIYTYDFATANGARILDASIVTPGSAITSIRLVP